MPSSEDLRFALPHMIGQSMDFVDTELRCFKCDLLFAFSTDEQRFFRENGFANDPKLCKPCKAKHSSREAPS